MQISKIVITGGVAPWTCGTNEDLSKMPNAAPSRKGSRLCGRPPPQAGGQVLIVCGRGTLDNKAYMDELEFSCVLSSLSTTEVALRDGYDAVFHLVTIAKGAEAFYKTANNTVRTETPEEAETLDDKLIAAWTGHPHFRVIYNSTDFEDKMKRLIAEISAFLGEPEPYEIERVSF